MLYLTFWKLFKKLKNKIGISKGASYIISVQLKSCEETLGDEGNSDYLTKLEPCKCKGLCSTIYSVWIVMINLKIKRKNLNPKSTLWWPGYGSFSVFDQRWCLVVKILWEHSFDRHFDSFNVSTSWDELRSTSGWGS